MELAAILIDAEGLSDVGPLTLTVADAALDTARKVDVALTSPSHGRGGAQCLKWRGGVTDLLYFRQIRSRKLLTLLIRPQA